MKTHTITEVKNDICSILREAEEREVLITRRGQPAAVIVGFKNEDDWFDYQLEHDPRFIAGIAKARQQIRDGQYVTLDDLPD
jgi:prevent-host-death family protein